jgi:4-carboxymuconolactone decarboxylase
MDTRYEQGLRILSEIAGSDAPRVSANLDAAVPGFSKAMIAYAFGDVYAREGLDLKTRELVTVGVLAAMGTATPQLRLHIAGSLNLGCTPSEIAETLVQASLYAGIPALLNSMAIAVEVFESHVHMERRPHAVFP